MEDLVKIVGKITEIRHPQDRYTVFGGEFGVFQVNVYEIKEGELLPQFGRPPMCTIPVAGKVDFDVSLNGDYTLVLSHVNNKTYGDQYEIQSGTSIHKDMSEDEIFWIYLSTIATDRQYNSLLDANEKYGGMRQAFENGDIGHIAKAKYFGVDTAKKMYMSFKSNEYQKNLLIMLKDFDFTARAKAKLLKIYNTEELMEDFVASVKANFYTVMDRVDGWGWVRTDKYARGVEGYSETCPQRIHAFIKYWFNKQANELGHSWMYNSDLCKAIREVAPNITNEQIKDYVQGMLPEVEGREEYNENAELYIDRSTKPQRIGSMALRKTEEAISANLFRLMRTPNFQLHFLEQSIKDKEKELGFEFTDEQKEVMRAISDNKVVVLTAPAGCVDCDTEFFNGEGWKRIADYQEGDRVLQYNEDGTAELVYPQRYIKNQQDSLWLTQTKYGVDMCLSDNHTVVYYTADGYLKTLPFSEVKRLHENVHHGGFYGKFVTSFNYKGEGIPLTDWEIKMMCAVICDGSFLKSSPNTTRCRFHIKKERKKERLRELFREGGVEWNESKSAAPGYTDFYFYAPLRAKVFSKEWYKASREQLQVICDNILFWDGCEDGIRKRFSSNVKENADFVQFAFSACGYKSVLFSRDRRGEFRGKYERKSIDYDIGITKRNLVSIGGFRKDDPNITKILPYKTIDGYEYCFTVPSHMWVMRRNGRILITGNCGKTWAMVPVVEALRRQGLTFKICSLSGKASLNIAEITNAYAESSTIHRLLRAIPDKEKEKNGDTKNAGSAFDDNDGYTKGNKSGLPCIHASVVIVDEVSMIGGFLFKDLLENIPDYAKLVLIGDEGQLEAIGYANILHDLKESQSVPVFKLTKVLRQAAKSGIITDSLKIYNKQQFIPADQVRETVHGELQDLLIIPRDEKEEIRQVVREQYGKLLSKGHFPADIMIVTQKRSKGPLSAVSLNQDIQDIVMPMYKGPSLPMNYVDGQLTYKIEYKVGDRVMVTRNAYDATMAPEDENFLTEQQVKDLGLTEKDDFNSVEIYNGNVGTVKRISFIEKETKAKRKKVEYSKAEMVVQFPQGCVLYTYDFDKKKPFDLQLGYAATCHKLQGMGIPYVIAVVDPSAYTLLTNEALYTEITRAKKGCVLVGPTRSIRMAVRKSSVAHKQTWLKEILIRDRDEYQKSSEETEESPFKRLTF